MRKFLRECLSEGDGQGSFGRLITLVIVTFVMGWDTSNVVFAWRFNLAHFQSPLPLLPDAMVLAAQGIFMTLFYGVNKFAGTYENVKVPALPAPPVPTAPTQ
jgi:hypothetical protein